MKTQIWCFLLLCSASVAVGARMIAQEGGSACKNLNVKTVTYLSPPLTAKPGEANNKYFTAEYPKGHIGIRSVNADLVDQNGIAIPLFENYLHHWILLEVAVAKDHPERHLHHMMHRMRRHHKHGMHMDATMIAALEAPHHNKVGRFPNGKVRNFLGKGGETRHTDSRLPLPYVKESGVELEGYENRWILNVHGLDTRGAVDHIGCSECRCHLYNTTTDEDGEPLPDGYIGGLRCCTDGRQCAVKEGFNGEEITFHLRYTWEYIDWNECLVPVTNLGIDVTNPTGFGENLIEFTVDGCGDADPNSEECLDTRVAYLNAPEGGEVVYSVSHLHSSILDASIWGEDGRLICRTTPLYGNGHEAGNEKDYVVGIKNCIGNPGAPDSMKIKQGERLKYIVVSTKVGGPHTGLMGLAGIQFVSDGVKSAI